MGSLETKKKNINMKQCHKTRDCLLQLIELRSLHLTSVRDDVKDASRLALICPWKQIV